MADVLSFGCRLNSLESELIRNCSSEAGLQDAVIVNTCAVTNEAVRQARQAIRKAKRQDPARPVIVTGCAAQIAPADFAAMPEVDLVLGNKEKLEAKSYADFDVSRDEKIKVHDISLVRETAGHLVYGFPDRSRGFVQIQNGCDHRCTFCIIPHGRGPSRSVPLGVVIEHVRRLVEKGFAELVLTGVDLTAYGADLPGRPGLGRLVRTILKLVPELPRLRLSSIDSVEVDNALFAVIAEEERLMPHFHLSLQSGDDMILKRMRRRHSRSQAIEFTTRVRKLRPHVVFGADLIAGFPTESEAAFSNSVDMIDDAGLSFIHVFPYSPRPGTPAARMPQLDRRLVKERAARLRQQGAAALAAHLSSETGSKRAVLVERPGFGRTEQFTPTRLVADQPGRIVRVLITGHDAGALTAVAA